jgi:hypothetical protein
MKMTDDDTSPIFEPNHVMDLAAMCAVWLLVVVRKYRHRVFAFVLSCPVIGPEEKQHNKQNYALSYLLARIKTLVH